MTTNSYKIIEQEIDSDGNIDGYGNIDGFGNMNVNRYEHRDSYDNMNIDNYESTNTDDYDEQTSLLKNNNKESSPNTDIQIDIETKTKNNTKPKRVYWVDWLRIFASILVVYIHVSYMYMDRGKVKSDKWNNIHNSLPRHCVPMFVMISGIFFLNPEKELTFKKLYKKYLLHIVKSLFFWAAYYAIVDNLIIRNRSKITFDKKLIKNTIDQMIEPCDHFWYLHFVIGLYVATSIYRCMTKERNIAWYAAALSMLYGQLIPTINKITNDFFHFKISYLNFFYSKIFIELTGNYSVYYLLGYLLSSHEFSKKSHIISLCVIGLVSQTITVIFRFMECYIKNKEANNFGDYNSFFVSLTTIGTFIFFKYYLNLIIEPLMEKGWIKKLILKLSECSFGVYLVHVTVFNIVHFCFNLGPTTFDPLWFIPIYTILIYILSFILIYLLRLIPIFKQVT